METNEYKQLNDKVKRLETKLTHMMEVFGINTKNTNMADLGQHLISIKKVDDITFISLLHKEVSVLELNKFLENHFGSIIVICGDEVLWQIIK